MFLVVLKYVMQLLIVGVQKIISPKNCGHVKVTFGETRVNTILRVKKGFEISVKFQCIVKLLWVVI